MPSTKSSVLATAQDTHVTEHLREAVILGALCVTPQVAEAFESGLENLTCRDPDHARLRDLLLRHAGEGAEALHDRISATMGPEALDNLLRARHVAIVPSIRTPGDAEMARMTVAEELAKLSAARGLDDEIADAVQDLEGVADEGVTWRLSQAAAAAADATRAKSEDSAEFETGDNGAMIRREERDAFAALMEQIRFAKPRS